MSYQPIYLMMRRFAFILLFLVLLAACGSPPPYRGGTRGFSKQEQLKIISTAGKYLGSPYKYGGHDSRGFDCSGLVVRVFREAIGMKLPRTTSKLFSISHTINARYAQPGDLVFFSINGGVDHVGVMINGYQFIHASKSSGVITSDFNNDYYRNHFYAVKRLR